MHLEDIRIFVTIVNMGSFTAAAEHLQLSKQYVSRRMAALERKISARLLVRNTGSCQLPIQDKFFHHAKRILEELYEAEQNILARQQKLAGSF